MSFDFVLAVIIIWGYGKLKFVLPASKRQIHGSRLRRVRLERRDWECSGLKNDEPID